MSLFGAEQIVFSRFNGGLVRVVDPTELDPDQAFRAENVDFRDFGLRKRLGKKPYNATIPTGMTAEKIRGLFAYYSADGSSRKLLAAMGAKVLCDTDGNGSFDLEVATGMTGTGMTDFVQFRNDVYFGNGADGVRKWTGSGASAAVSLLPEVAFLGMSSYAPVLDSFDYSSTPTAQTSISAGWVRTDTNVSIGRDTEEQLEGLSALTVTFAAGSKGDSISKAFSYAPRVDLSQADNILLWYQASKANVSFQIGVIPNDYGATLAATMTDVTASCTVSDSFAMEEGDYLRIESEIVKITSINGNVLAVERAQFGTAAAAHNTTGVVVQQTVNWDMFDAFISAKGDVWIPLRVSLSKVAPSRRTGSIGFGIRMNALPAFPVTFKFDQLQAEGVLVADDYRYSVTNGVVERIDDIDVLIQESNPGSAAPLKVDDLPPIYGVRLEPARATGNGINVVRIYRYRTAGPFRQARLVGTAPTGDTTLAAAVTDSPRLEETWTLASVLGLSRGSVVQVDSERVLVLDVDQATNTVDVARGWDGTTAATHSNGADVDYVFHFDAKSDGALALEVAEELISGKIAPPVAKTYALVNGSMWAGNVLIDGTWYPDRLYRSRLGFPEEFSSTQEPAKGFDEPGWVRIPTRDHIRRILEHDGDILVLCDRSVWVLEGSGWDDFTLRQRANFGLDGREAVAAGDRMIWLLAADGVRVLAPNLTNVGLFESWVMSEPVDDLVRGMTAAERAAAAFGIDERGRLLVSIGTDEVLIFDPFIGEIQPGHNAKRRGWHYYTKSTAHASAPGWGASCYYALKRGSGDAGQLLAGDLAAGVVWYLHRDSSDAELLADYSTDGAGTLTARAITWLWQGMTQDAGPGVVLEWSYVGFEADAVSGQSIVVTPVLDGSDYGSPYTVSLASTKAFAAPTKTTGPAVRGRFSALKLASPSTGHSVDVKIRSSRIGYYPRG